MKAPKLSIIVPVYNAEKYIRDCLNSLLCQSVNGGYEVICINDGSKDSSKQILDEYAEKHPDLIKVFHKSNGGVSGARNLGISEASGKYVTFVDAHDFILRNSIGRVIEFLEKEDAVAAIMEDHIKVDAKSNYVDFPDFLQLSYRKSNTSSSVCWCLIIDRELVIRNNLMFNEKMPIGEDTVFVATCQFYYWDNCLTVSGGYYCYRENPNSVMHTRDRKKELQSHIDMVDVYEQIFSQFREDDHISPELKKQFYSRLCASVGNVLFFAIYTGEDFIERYKIRKLYPYPMQWWTLKGCRSVKSLAINGLKLFFPFEWFYKIVYKMLRGRL